MIASFFIFVTLAMLPAIIAIGRGHQNAVAILLFTLFLSWTGIGWIVALIWSLTAATKRANEPVVITNQIFVNNNIASSDQEAGYLQAPRELAPVRFIKPAFEAPGMSKPDFQPSDSRPPAFGRRTNS